MSVSIPSRKPSTIVCPKSDGKPMAENTLQFEWIVTIKQGWHGRSRRARTFSSPGIYSGIRSRADRETSDSNRAGVLHFDFVKFSNR